MVSNECPTIDQILCRDNSVSQTSSIAANDLADYFEISSVRDKGAGSYLAGVAVAIPILNVDGRRHTNNFSKNIKNVKNINFKV